jgi:hypothetical protein
MPTPDEALENPNALKIGAKIKKPSSSELGSLYKLFSCYKGVIIPPN